jgi:hypothetical protein
VTLTEYLTQQAAELRVPIEDINRRRYVPKFHAALADHIEATLAEYQNVSITLELVPDGMYAKGAKDAVEREMESLARLVSVVTGTPIPEGTS